jgi:hypothetical protein
VRQSAGAQRCVTWSVRALIQAAAEAIGLERVGESSSTSPKVPLVVNVQHDAVEPQPSRPQSTRSGRHHIRHDIAETAVTIDT